MTDHFEIVNGGTRVVTLRGELDAHDAPTLRTTFSEALEGAPEYPHYTRPADWRGWTVPDVLLSGHHARVNEWRRAQSKLRGAGPLP